MPIATLIAAGRLDDRLVETALHHLRHVSPSAAFSAWIDEGDAADLEFTGHLKSARAALEQLAHFDVVIQKGSPRVRRLLVADMDSTIIGQECIDELADYVGLKPQVAAITDRAMHGELDFADALRERVALLAGLEETVIARCLTERIRLNPGAETLVRTMQAHGAETILVSGGFTAFVAPIAGQAGFDRFEANVLGVEGGWLTGRTEGRIVDSTVKRDVLVAARARLGLGFEDVLAIGDGANDRLMVEEAGMGVAYRAKPALAAVADVRLDQHGLDAMLWAQGIPRREWVTG